MRALKVLVVLMGVMIVGGVVLLGVLLVRRAGPGASYAATLAEPEGTSIAAIAAQNDGLALQLRGGGPDRVLVLDIRTGRVVGRVGLGR